MGIKFSIKEAWLLDESGNKSMKLIPFDPNEVFTHRIDHKEVRGGYGTHQGGLIRWGYIH